MPDRSSRCRKLAWGLFVSLTIVVPGTAFGVWGSFEKDKTIPQWFAERGWPMLVVAGLYLASAVAVSILFYALCRWIDRPRLTGKIICLEADPRLDVKDNDYDCFVTLSVELRNSGTPTTTNPFSLDLWWKKESHPGTSEPLDGYYVETYGREPGEERSQRAIRTTDLTGFPYDEEITTTNHKRGWVRFSFGSLPLEMVKNGHLAKEVIVELTAFDNERKPHTIYKKAMYKGVIRLIAGCGKIKQRPADDFFYSK